MLNIVELENKHKKYKMKSYMPKFTIIAFISIVVISFFINFSTNTKEEKTPIFEEKKTKILHKENVLKKPSPIVIKEKIKETSPPIILSPSFNFIKEIEKVVSVTPDVEKTIEEPKLEEPKLEKPKLEEPVQKPIVDSISDNEIKISRQNTNKDIQHVLKRFENDNNPALSLFVAKKYYELAQYDKSYNYALITNNINSAIDDSWIIFTKSLVKLNKRDKAISVLSKYIKQSNSTEAKILLDEIISGKFNE